MHIHAFEQSHPEVESHLLFRDYLLDHPEEAIAYEKVKLELIQDPAISRATYTDSKAPFIQQALREARQKAALSLTD